MNQYEYCLEEINLCFDEEDYEEIDNLINESYRNDEITDDEYEKLKEIHHEKNHLYTKSIDDYDWEIMKMFNPDLSDQ